MTDMRERLKQAMTEAGFKPADVSRTLGVSKAAVSRWLSAGTITRDNLARVAELCGVSVDYLVSGIGADSVHPVHMVPVIGSAIATPNGAGYFTDMGLPAGGSDEFVPFPSRDVEAYAVKVRGDSMTPRIRPGDLIVVEPNTAATPGDDVLVKLSDGRKMVKQMLFKRAGHYHFASVNGAHELLTVAVEEVDAVHKIAAIVTSGASVNP